MSACFILSLDCEGKWGVSDHLAPRHHAQLSDDRLHAAYKDIFAVLDRYEIAATFAITGFFGMSRRELLALPYGDIMRRLPYTKNAFHDILDGSKQGWSAEWLHSELNIRHERALHGISHTPYNMMDSDTAKFELSLMPVQAGQTFVFPRNAISHVDILQREIAIIGYRQARPSNRFSRLIDELNIFEASEQQQPSSGPVRIPAGYFVNWKSGVRKLVPT